MKYYCIKQHDITDCGAACLATICRQNGYKIGISKIREVAGTDKQGTNAYGVIKAAEQLGFSAKGVKGDREVFFSEFPLPCIAHVIVDLYRLCICCYIFENKKHMGSSIVALFVGFFRIY